MIDAEHVHETLKRYQLVDGYSIVMDMERSHGAWLKDARTGDEYLDAFTCFASWPIGYRHPAMDEPSFRAELLRAAQAKPSNSDLYTREMASFVAAFAARVTPPGFPHHFWVAGGALAVENALKTAFDWKARKLGRTSFTDDVNDIVILHLREAFHGRSGYTMSLTNTIPDKIGLYPKFAWPRVHNPAIRFDLEGGIANDVEAEERTACREIEEAFARHGDKIAAIIVEPMQGEGGDNHFRSEFFRALRRYADEHDALLIYDEVQTGFFGSGKPWLWQMKGVAPDIVCFGKKAQICGLYASNRIDEVPNNVFAVPSRINSTWGGDLVDMVRCRRFIEIIEGEDLAGKVADRGDQLLRGLRSLAREQGSLENVRGVGSLVAFDMEGPEVRKATLRALYAQKVLALPTGKRGIRFRLPFVIQPREIDEILNRLSAALPVRT